MRVFKDLNMVEQLGSGVLRILEKYDRDVFKISDIQRILNLKEARVRVIIAKMCNSGLLEKHGKSRGTYYTKK